MSIILREKLQPLLDAKGLDFLHVGVLEKTLNIVGECGKPLVKISGIVFDTNTPKMREIPFAADLFSKFLTKFEADIKNLINIKRELKKIGHPFYEGEHAVCNWSGKITTKEVGGVVLQLNKQKGVSEATFKVLINDITPSFSFEDLRVRFVAFVEDTSKYRKAQIRYNKCLKENTAAELKLASCDI